MNATEKYKLCRDGDLNGIQAALRNGETFKIHLRRTSLLETLYKNQHYDCVREIFYAEKFKLNDVIRHLSISALFSDFGMYATIRSRSNSEVLRSKMASAPFPEDVSTQVIESLSATEFKRFERSLPNYLMTLMTRVFQHFVDDELSADFQQYTRELVEDDYTNWTILCEELFEFEWFDEAVQRPRLPSLAFMLEIQPEETDISKILLLASRTKRTEDVLYLCQEADVSAKDEILAMLTSGLKCRDHQERYRNAVQKVDDTDYTKILLTVADNILNSKSHVSYSSPKRKLYQFFLQQLQWFTAQKRSIPAEAVEVLYDVFFSTLQFQAMKKLYAKGVEVPSSMMTEFVHEAIFARHSKPRIAAQFIDGKLSIEDFLEKSAYRKCLEDCQEWNALLKLVPNDVELCRKSFRLTGIQLAIDTGIIRDVDSLRLFYENSKAPSKRKTRRF